MQETIYFVGIHSPNTVYALDENDKPLIFKTEAEAQAKADEMGGEYAVIPQYEPKPEKTNSEKETK